MGFVEKLLRSGEGRIVKKLSSIADQVSVLEPDLKKFTDAELAEQTQFFRERLAAGETLDDLMVEAFATVREAAFRVLGQRPYDVQVMGAAALHLGNIAEMKTGEGKTLVATMPAYLNALSGDGVHVVTVNDYLASRDASWMGRVHRFLGMTVGVITSDMDPEARRAAYECDITYGTNNEFGFDYLRDNMAVSEEGMVQRGHNFAIVDEVDSILIDEARTPLIIAGPAAADSDWYVKLARLAARLRKDTDYEVDIKKRTVSITDDGVQAVEDWLGVTNLYKPEYAGLIGSLNNAIRAKELFEKDKEYVVMSGEVLIVDEHTGRVLHGRRYSEGLHQAIEAKEGVEIQEENQTLATITLQNYFRMYSKLSGMTGTAMTEAAEFSQIYKLGVVPIPTNKPNIRVDHPDLVYISEAAKYSAVVDDIVETHETGQPILVGTASVEKSEVLSALLTEAGIDHEVLNAKQPAREAGIIASAGRLGAVTVATNMAGRGTDIILGGNPEYMATSSLEKEGYSPDEDPDEYNKLWKARVQTMVKVSEKEHDQILELGGLYVVATERHESRRIDNQLRGRSARQGDPGSTRFYLSLEDDLMLRFNSGFATTMLTRLNMPEDVPIQAKVVSKAIAGAQSQVESHNFEIRKDILKYDEVLNRQRTVIYSERARVLHGENLEDEIRTFIDAAVDTTVSSFTSEGYPEQWDLSGLLDALHGLYGEDLELSALPAEIGADIHEFDSGLLVTFFSDRAQHFYDVRVTDLGETVSRELERQVLLSVLDDLWKTHLYEMNYLQEGIGMRAIAQRDPLVEYQKEGLIMFYDLLDRIRHDTVSLLFKVSPPQESDVEVVSSALPEFLSYSGPSEDGTVSEMVEPTRPETPSQSPEPTPVPPAAGSKRSGLPDDTLYAKTPRNAPCPCGSGKKFKRCHGAPANLTTS